MVWSFPPPHLAPLWDLFSLSFVVPEFFFFSLVTSALNLVCLAGTFLCQYGNYVSTCPFSFNACEDLEWLSCDSLTGSCILRNPSQISMNSRPVLFFFCREYGR